MAIHYEYMFPGFHAHNPRIGSVHWKALGSSKAGVAGEGLILERPVALLKPVDADGALLSNDGGWTTQMICSKPYDWMMADDYCSQL